MRPRSSVIAVMVCLVAVPTCLPIDGVLAHAQTLDLSPPSTKPRTAGRAITRATELEREANRVNAPSDSGTPFSAEHDLARARVRILAAKLLREGEKRGMDGQRLLLAGTILSDDLTELDRWITPPTVTGATAKEVASRIDDLLKSGLGEIADMDRALHTALGPLLPEKSIGLPESWWAAVDTSGQRSAPIISSQLIAQRLQFDNAESVRAEQADAWISDAATRGADSQIAIRLMKRLSSAARGWTEPPSWLTPSAGSRLAKDARDTISHVAEAPTSAQADLSTRRAAAIAEILQRVDDLSGVAQSRVLRQALNTGVTTLGSPSQIDVARWIMLRDALRLTDSTLVPDADTLQPISRMAILQMTPAVRRARDQLLGVLPRLLAPEPVLTDPGILNGVAALRRKVQEAGSVVRLGESLRAARDVRARKDGVIDAALATKIEQLVLARAQEFNKPDTRDLALARLLELDEELAACFALPGEEQLRDDQANSIYDALAGPRREALLNMLDARRNIWLDAVASAVPRKPIAERLTDVGPAWSRYFQLAAATDVPSALQEWGGWHTAPSGVGALAEGGRFAKEKADLAIDAGNWNAFVAGVNSVPADHPALVLGRLALEADRTRPAPDEPDPSLPAPPVSLLKLTRGGPDPDGSWFVDGRDAVASVCAVADDAVAMREAFRAQAAAKPNEKPKLDVKAVEWIAGRMERAASLLASHLDLAEASRRLRR